MNKGLLTLFLGIFFLVWSSSRPSQKKVKPAPSSWGHQLSRTMKKAARVIKKESLDKTRGKVIVSMVFGIKRGLPKKLLHQFSSLSLLHLFTPSGLHFTAILLFLTPFLNLEKRRSKPIKKCTLTILSLFTFFLDGFYSLKRIALLKLITLFLGQKLSFYYLFLLAFALDFSRGSFFQSPLSFSYSFLFLGLLLSTSHFNWKSLLFLFTGQCTVIMMQNESLYFAGPFLGMVITAIFTFFFPILLLSLIFLPWGGMIFSEWWVGIFIKLVQLFYKLGSMSLKFTPTFFHLVLLVILLSSFTYKIKRASFLALFTLFSLNCY